MKKMPKEIKELLKKINSRGYAAALAGPALFNLILDRDDGPVEWDIVVEGTPEEINLILKKEILQNVNLIYCQNTLHDWAESNWITASAVLYNGHDFIDPYNGRKDIEEEKIQIVEGKDRIIAKHPIKLLDIILEVGKTDFELSDESKTLIIENLGLLRNMDKTQLAQKFQEIMSQTFTGRALRTMDRCGVMEIIVGEKVYQTRNKKEKQAMELYMKNIDKTLPITERRIVSFYLGFWKKRDMKAMNNLNYSQDISEKLKFAHEHLSDLFYMNKPTDLKDFLYKYGIERYTFLNNISKIQAKVYNLDTKLIATRFAFIRNIASNNEPVFLEDLAMKAHVLIEEGLAKDQEDADDMIKLLLYIVHRRPDYNEPNKLLSQAYRLNKNPLKKMRTRLYGKKF